jgi:hypothetical protein
MQQLLRVWVETKQTASIQDLQSLCGKLQFAAKVVRRGRAYLRRLIDLTREIKAKPGVTPHQQFPLTRSARADVRWWRDFLVDWNGKSLFYESQWKDSETIQLFTDASGKGFGGHFGAKRWFRGQWSPEQLQRAWRKKHISMPFLELHSLVQAATVWGHLWSSMRITFRCDCQPAFYAINSMSSTDSDKQRLLRHMDLTAARHGFDYRAVWVAGKANAIADYLSRRSDDQEFSLAGLRKLMPEANAEPDPMPPLPPYEDM